MPPTRLRASTLRRVLFTALAVTAAGGALAVGLPLSTGPSATAAADPCAASEVAKTIGNVAISTGQYLEKNPKTNQALTTISKQQAGPESLSALKAFFDANPQVTDDIVALQQPLTTLSGRCKLPITAPQLMELMQAAQGQGALPGGLPNAQGVSAPGAPAHSVTTGPGATGTAAGATTGGGTGPLPGPASSTGR